MSIPLFSKVTDKIIMIHLSDTDSNIYIVGQTVIDTGTGLNFVRLMDVLRRIKVNMEDIKQIVNTHAHFDHVGGNGFFDKAGILIHEKDAEILEKGDKEKSVADFFGGNFHPMRVEKKLKEGDIVEGFKVIHTPGHTEGSICLFDEKTGVLISGDTVFQDGVGRTDLPGGSEEAMMASFEKLQGLKIKTILPGHGAPVKGDCNKHIEALQEFSDFR